MTEKKWIPHQRLPAARLAIISYPGQGKYAESGIWFYDEFLSDETIMRAFLEERAPAGRPASPLRGTACVPGGWGLAHR